MVVGDIATGTDVVVIGGGPGGYTAAMRAAQKDKDVVLVEKEDIGGTCLNRGCIPAKAFIHSSKMYEKFLSRDEKNYYGEEDLDFSEVQNWKNSIVDKLNGGVRQILRKHDVEIKKGEARFIDSKTVRVEEEHRTDKIEFENAVIATGSQPMEIPGLEFSQEKIISSRELLNLEEVPEELVIVGGGYIGMEAATKFSKFGSEVKVVEAMERILGNFDEEIVRSLKNSNSDYADTVYESTKAKEVSYRDGKAVLIAEKEDKEIEIEGDYILVAVGRTPKNITEELGLENTSIEPDKHGFIEVDSQMRTSEENIFAIGDVAGQPMLAHKAYREGRVAAEVVAGEPAAFDNQVIPKVMYTDPEVAVVGKSLEEAEEEYGDELKVGRFPFSASGRAMTVDDTSGFVRVLACPKGKLLGVQMVGVRVSDMISEATLALEMQAYLDDIVNTIHAHPTFPEAFAEACEDAQGNPIHTV